MEQNLFSLAELNHLRIEAMNLFEQCLANHDSALLEAFIEHQLLHEPPRLHLLRGLADDLHQRLLSLREYHFDVRERVVRTLLESYGIDISSLTPPSLLDQYHCLTALHVLEFASGENPTLSEKDVALIRKMVEASLQTAAQLYSDIQLTTRLYLLVLDWLEGMNATAARQYWGAYPHTPADGPSH